MIQGVQTEIVALEKRKSKLLGREKGLKAGKSNNNLKKDGKSYKSNSSLENPNAGGVSLLT